MVQGFDFTIAVSPDSLMSLDREMKYIKSALLYADSIKLISPIAHTYFELTDEKYNRNERQAIGLLEQVLPFVKMADLKVYHESKPAISTIKHIVSSKRYKSVPMPMKIQLKRELHSFVKGINASLSAKIGNETCEDMSFLIKSNKVILETFQSSFDDADEYVMEYFKKLERSISNSYPLFDEQANSLMGSAIGEGIVNISDIEKHKAVHAGITDRLLLKLPSFEFAKVDEILDIRKELEKSLTRFRSKIIEYTENIQTLPWNKDFEDECFILYNREIVPSILEIEEMIEDNNIIKNLGITLLTDQSVLNSAGSLVLGVAAAGVISSFTNAIASDKTLLVAGGAWAIPKIASAYNDYKVKEKEIERKDLYFYYKAGESLSNIG